MKDLKIYLLTIVASLLLVIPTFFYDSELVSVLSGIGCSGIAASMMAIYLERESYKRDIKKLEQLKHLYFNQLNSQLSMIAERLLWLSERVADKDFDWNLQDREYSTMGYMVSFGTRYPEKTVSYKEAVERLRAIGNKYNLENITYLPKNEREKAQKMFSIVATSSVYLINEIKAVKDDELKLCTEGMITFEDCNQLLFDVSLAVSLMSKTDKNYEAAIKSLIAASDKVRQIGGFTNEIRIGMHGSVGFDEL